MPLCALLPGKFGFAVLGGALGFQRFFLRVHVAFAHDSQNGQGNHVAAAALGDARQDAYAGRDRVAQGAGFLFWHFERGGIAAVHVQHHRQTGRAFRHAAHRAAQFDHAPGVFCGIGLHVGIRQFHIAMVLTAQLQVARRAAGLTVQRRGQTQRREREAGKQRSKESVRGASRTTVG